MTLLLGLVLAMAQEPSGHLLVVNQGDKTVSVVDAATRQVIRTIDEQQSTMHAHEAAASPDGKTAYLPIYGNVGVGAPGLDGSEMLVVDLASGTIRQDVAFGHGVRPHCVVYEPARKLIYVTTELDQTVSILDPATGKILGSIPTGQKESHMIAITRDGKWGYVSNVAAGTVSVLDLVNRKLVKIVRISNRTQRIVLSRNDKWVFAGDDTADRMAVIDTKTNEVAKRVDLPGHSFGSAATLDGQYILAPIPSKDRVAVISVKAMKVVQTIPVDRNPQEMLVSPAGRVAYVSCAGAGVVDAIDLHQMRASGKIEVGNYPDGLAWAP